MSDEPVDDAEPILATAGPPRPGGRALGAVLAGAALVVAWGLARHPAFQPSHALRLAAPVLALALGGAWTRLLARARARVDGEREFDRGGKALFMGFAMVAATLVGWLLVSQALPAAVTAWTGADRDELGVVTHRVADTGDADCRFRLVVAGAEAGGGSLPRPYDACVDPVVWRGAGDGGAVTLRLRAGALGAELRDVGPAPASS